MKYFILSVVLLSNLLNPAYAKLSQAEIECNQALQQNQPKEAIKQADALIEKNANSGNAYICKGRALFALAQVDAAIEAFAQAEKVSPDVYNKSFSSLLAGHVYKNSDQLEAAVTAYQRSLSQAITAQHQGLIFSNHMNIGHVYLDQQAIDKALASYELAYKTAGNDNERADAETKIAQTYYIKKDYDKAIEYQLKSVLGLQRVGTLDLYAQSLVAFVTYQTSAKRYADAEKYNNKLIKLAKENGGIYYEAKGQLMMAKIKADQNALEEAKALLVSAKANAAKSQDQDLIAAVKTYTEQLAK